MLRAIFLHDLRDTGSTFAGFGCQRTGALFEGNEHERSDGIFWAMDDDLISGWFLNGERFKAILKFLCGPFLNVMIDIYCVTVLYICFYISVCIFLCHAFNFEVYLNDSNVHLVFHADVLWWTNGTGMGQSCHPNLPNFCTHEKSWKWRWKSFSLHIIIIYIFTELYHSYYILPLCNYRLLILWIQYTIWITNLNVYMSYIKRIHTNAAHDNPLVQLNFFSVVQVRIKELLSDEKAIFPRWEREVMGGSLVVDIGCLVEQLVDYLLFFGFRMV